MLLLFQIMATISSITAFWSFLQNPSREPGQWKPTGITWGRHLIITYLSTVPFRDSSRISFGLIWFVWHLNAMEKGLHLRAELYISIWMPVAPDNVRFLPVFISQCMGLQLTEHQKHWLALLYWGDQKAEVRECPDWHSFAVLEAHY